MAPTPNDIRRRGLEALRRELGPAGMVRFLQQLDTGSGDYARERHSWVDQSSLEDIRAAAGRKTSRKK